MICPWFTVFVIVNLVSGYIVEPGPKVEATKGEVWPKPQKQIWGDGYLVLKPTNFDFQVVKHDCDLLQTVLRRYKDVVYDSSHLGRRGKHLRNTKITRSYKTWRNDAHFVGYLNVLDVELTELCSSQQLPSLGMDEKYTLDINMTMSGVNSTLRSNSIWGVMRGLETFSQLLYLSDDNLGLIINRTFIEDYPRFSHRGLLLDTSRHFQPMFSILRTLDAMCYNKMNVFHWHIVDDQSFPYVSQAFPNMSVKGAYHPELIYTQEDVRRVINYAKERGIRVMVEFDTPGHTRSWGEGIPKLLTTCYTKNKPNGYFGPIDPSRPANYEFLQKFFSEVVNVFPDQYVHLGGDEVDFDCWQSNPQITMFMKDNNITSYTDLEQYYIQKLVDIIDDLNASSMVWEEVFVNGVHLHKDTVVHIWKGGSPETVISQVTEKGLRALLSACWYLDFLQGGGDWQKYYKCEPLDFPGTDEQKKLVIGGEACMWSEVVDATNVLSRVWPRACAAAEKLWSDRSVTDINEAARRLEEHTCRMQLRGIPAQPPNGPGFCI